MCNTLSEQLSIKSIKLSCLQYFFFFFSFGWVHAEVHVFVLALLGHSSTHYLYKVTSVADCY